MGNANNGSPNKTEESKNTMSDDVEINASTEERDISEITFGENGYENSIIKESIIDGITQYKEINTDDIEHSIIDIIIQFIKTNRALMMIQYNEYAPSINIRIGCKHLNNNNNMKYIEYKNINHQQKLDYDHNNNDHPYLNVKLCHNGNIWIISHNKNNILLSFMSLNDLIINNKKIFTNYNNKIDNNYYPISFFVSPLNSDLYRIDTNLNSTNKLKLFKFDQYQSKWIEIDKLEINLSTTYKNTDIHNFLTYKVDIQLISNECLKNLLNETVSNQSNLFLIVFECATFNLLIYDLYSNVLFCKYNFYDILNPERMSPSKIKMLISDEIDDKNNFMLFHIQKHLMGYQKWICIENGKINKLLKTRYSYDLGDIFPFIWNGYNYNNWFTQIPGSVIRCNLQNNKVSFYKYTEKKCFFSYWNEDKYGDKKRVLQKIYINHDILKYVKQ